MTRRWLWAGAVALAILAALPSAQPAQSGDKAAVYAALFNDDRKNANAAPVVQNTAIPIPGIGKDAVADWLSEWNQIPATLRRVVEAPMPTTSIAFPSELFPKGTRFLARAEIDAIFATLGPEEGWQAFRKRFNSFGYVSVSEIVFSPDQNDALLYYESRCGSLCGTGAYVWLRRDSRSSPWSVRRTVVSWVS